MLSRKRFEEVKKILEAGISNRKAATATGVSRNTVNAIASGKFELHRQKRGRKLFDAGPEEKCPECGVVVKMPCLKCQLEQEEKKHIFVGDDWQGKDLALNLEEADRRRYARVAKSRRERDRDRSGEFEGDAGDPATSPRIVSEGCFGWGEGWNTPEGNRASFGPLNWGD